MKNRRVICIFTIIMLLITSVPVFAQETDNTAETNIYEIYVSPGRGGAGTIDNPAGSILQAKELARKAVANNPGLEGVKVYFREGVYPVNQTITFTGDDSGTEQCPIIYEAYPGEQVIFDGGITIPGKEFSEVTDKAVLESMPKSARKYARVIDLSTIPGYEPFSPATDPNTFTFSYGGDKMQVARWPNASWAKTGDIIKNGLAMKTGIEFVVNEDNILKWSNAKHAWLIGMWVWTWAVEQFPLTKVDLNTRSVGGDEPIDFNPVTKNKNWYIYNLIQEMDIENEFYFDFDNSLLYIYPYEEDINDGSFQNKDVQIPITPNLISMKDTSYVEFRNIIMENFSGDVVSMQDTRYCAIRGCTIRNCGGMGASIIGTKAYKCFIDSCHIYNLAHRAIQINAGDTVNVIKGECEAINNKIHNTEIAKRTNAKTLLLGGVGNRAAHNEIFNVPHIGLDIRGQQNVFEYNEMYDILSDGAGDAGTMHTGRMISVWDNSLRHNYFHDLNAGAMGVIYQDDQINGLDIYGNIFYQTGRAAFMHGGDYNNFHNNLIIHPLRADSPGILYGTCEAMTWDTTTMKSTITEHGTYSWEYTTYTNDAAAHYFSDIFRETYPDFAKLMESGIREWYPGGKAGNNVAVYKHEVPENVQVVAKPDGNPEDAVNIIGPDYVTAEDIGFVDMANNNFALKEDAAIYDILPEFKDVHFEKMGRYPSEYGAIESKIDEFSLIYPKDKTEDIEAREVTLIWKGQPDTKLYEVEIATDKNFTENVRKETLEGTQLTIKNLRYGKVRYYWRVTAINQNAKSIPAGTRVPCNVDYFSFVTADKETIDYADAHKMIEKTEANVDTLVE